MDSMYARIRREAEELTEQTLRWRRDIHAHPEMANQERRTAAMAAAHLKRLGIDEVYEQLAGGTGVIGILHGAAPGPTVGLRADMDAQTVLETTGLPFASREVCQWGGETLPVMHCCGHDVHTAMLMAAASVLSGMRGELRGKVLFLFQPAEEGPPPGWKGAHGAKAMMEEPVFQKNIPDAMFTLHIDPNQPIGTAGQLAFAPGQTCMAISGFEIHVTGLGGHNAKPWLGRDALLPAAQILEGLQQIVTRNVNPNTNRVVLTVGQLLGGTKYNVIADRAVLRGACRFSDYGTRAYLEQRIEQVAGGIAASGGVTAQVDWTLHYPPNFNDADLVRRMTPHLERALGPGRVTGLPERCEQFPDDFSHYTLQIPSIYALLSCAPDEGDPSRVPGLHTPDLLVNERCIPEGVKALAAFAAACSRVAAR